jgi:O-antigen/teichoic acid export membrane protein
MTGSGMTLKEKSKPYMWISLIAASTNFLLNFYFIPKYGFIGASITTIISNIVFFIVGYNWSQKYFKINWQIEKHIILFIISFTIAVFFPFAKIFYNIEVLFIYKVLIIFFAISLPFLLRIINLKTLMQFILKK